MTFLVITVLYIPQLVVNVTGSSSSLTESSFAFQDTTFGHLGELSNATYVYLPGTNCGGVRCTMGKDKVTGVEDFVCVSCECAHP